MLQLVVLCLWCFPIWLFVVFQLGLFAMLDLFGLWLGDVWWLLIIVVCVDDFLLGM